MDKKTITTDAYIARDGKPFLDAGECLDYERNVLDKLENIKYFRVRYAPDLTETGCFTKCFYCAVYSENTGYSWRLLTKNDEDAVNSTDIIHSWSLGALINVLPEKINEGTTDYARLEMGKDRVGYYRANGQTLFASMQDDLICDCFNIILELRRRNKQ